MDERTELPRDYVCPDCGDMADVHSVGEDSDGSGRIVAIRLRCPKSHEWRVPGKSALNLIMDPRAEPLYDLADRRIAEERRATGGVR